MALIATVLLGIVLGISEFLPVSSVGHSLILSTLLNFPPTKPARDTFAIFIEGGALLAVLLFYRRDLLTQARKLPTDPATQRFWLNVVIAFVPIGVIGFVFHDVVEQYLFSSWIVAVSLIVGGMAFIVVERRPQAATTRTLADVTPRQALLIGLSQIAALIPGVSRSGATIIGGLLCGLDRETATGFTFYLFIPTLTAASGYELFNAIRLGTVDAALLPYFLLAACVGFIVALGAMRWLLRYVVRHDFQAFGVYRIVVGLIVLALIALRVIP